MESKRLPNGKYTKDINQYIKQWRALGRKAVKYFPGYKLAGFDPHVWLTKYDDPRVGSMILTVDQINSFPKICKCKDK